MNNLRRIFIVVAGGNPDAELHFENTIRRKRNLSEVRSYLPESEIKNLENIYHNSSFIVWGSVPGKMNEPRWEKMQTGDILLIYNRGYIKFIGEVAAKVRSKELARYFWKEAEGGSTWELMYFIVNEEKVNVPLEKLNPLIGYQTNYSPQGFTMISDDKVLTFTKSYGDLLGVIKTLEKGEQIHEKPQLSGEVIEKIDERIDRAPTEHDEMQWRLIRMGKSAKCDVWVPANDKGKQFNGNIFKNFVLDEFHQSMDIPPTIKNIDVVWKFGPYSIKSAFEIEHSTSVYSGILRLSDLHAETPNSQFPLFIIAAEDRRRKVFDELRRPTFSSPCLRLNEVVRYLSYKKVREIDESSKDGGEFDSNILFNSGEMVD